MENIIPLLILYVNEINMRYQKGCRIASLLRYNNSVSDDTIYMSRIEKTLKR